MSAQEPTAEHNPIHDHNDPNSDRQHSKDRALPEREFELLMEGAREVARCNQYYDPDPEFTIYALGRLGLRRGELVHLQEDWISWHDSTIRIPAHEPCRKGEDGGPCSDCTQSAKQRVDHADDLTREQALKWSWAPKTEDGVRDVYYGHDVRMALYLERYFDSEQYDEYNPGGSAVGRRVKRAAEKAPELDPDDVHPHGLRATAASFMAGRGVGQYQLMQHFGWAQPSTALHYISRSSVKTARQLEGMGTS